MPPFCLNCHSSLRNMNVCDPSILPQKPLRGFITYRVYVPYFWSLKETSCICGWHAPVLAPCCALSLHHGVSPLSGSCCFSQAPWLGSSILPSTGWPTWKRGSACLPSGTATSSAAGLPTRPLLRTGTSVHCGRNGRSCWWISQRWVSGHSRSWLGMPTIPQALCTVLGSFVNVRAFPFKCLSW